MSREVAATCYWTMPDGHPVTPGLRLAEVALVLAAALAGSPVPQRLAAAEIAPMLARGVRACGGLEGVRRLDQRNRAIIGEIGPDGGPPPEQRRERQAIWSGDERRAQDLVDLAFRVLNTPNNWHPEPGTTRAEK